MHFDDVVMNDRQRHWSLIGAVEHTEEASPMDNQRIQSINGDFRVGPLGSEAVTPPNLCESMSSVQIFLKTLSIG